MLEPILYCKILILTLRCDRFPIWMVRFCRCLRHRNFDFEMVPYCFDWTVHDPMRWPIDERIAAPIGVTATEIVVIEIGPFVSHSCWFANQNFPGQTSTSSRPHAENKLPTININANAFSLSLIQSFPCTLPWSCGSSSCLQSKTFQKHFKWILSVWVRNFQSLFGSFITWMAKFFTAQIAFKWLLSGVFP